MTTFNIRLLLRNKVLWAWPILAILLALLVGWFGNIESAGNSYSFLLSAGDSPAIPSAFLINGLLGFFILIAVIGLPSHLGKNLDPERASLIFSKPVIRSEFFFSEFAAVMSVTVFYTLITDIVLAVLLAAKAGIFPSELYLAILLYIPLYVFVIYVSIVLLLLLTGSHLASVLIAYLLVAPISGLLLQAETFLNLLGWNSELMVKAVDGLSYLIPSTAGVDKLMAGFESPPPSGGGDSIDQMMSGILYNGFAAFDWQLFGFVLVSCLPFFLLSFYMMRRKQF
jgi:ABC-type transport system involved in multi-copper enzyme maturation permease subunit